MLLSHSVYVEHLMPILQVDLTKPADIKAGIAILRQHLDGGPKPAQGQQPAAAQPWLAQAIIPDEAT